jgi:fused signal recognition particle receptor
MGVEIVYLLAALAGVALVVALIRRAAGSGQLKEGVRDRLREGEDEDEGYDDYDEYGERDEGEEELEEDEDLGDEDLEDEAAEAPEPEEPEELEDDESERLRKGLAKTRSTGFVARLGRLLGRKKIDEDILGDLEEVLFSADIGPKTAQKLVSGVKDALKRSEMTDSDAIWSQLREQSATILRVDSPPVDYAADKPFVLLVLGVNGVGKTTTIGKLAGKLVASGKSVLMAAGDTFRAAAVEQLQEWGKRAGCPVVSGKPKADPSSVIFDAIKRAQDEDIDVVIADTAGRLHTKVDLMEELKKIGRVIDKAMPGAPHETWLVLDSTTGQNAIQQALIFREVMAISGIVLTKLDGTAKGGVILGICDEMQVPVRFIGIGETIDDLREFDPDAFVSALYDEVEADAA